MLQELTTLSRAELNNLRKAKRVCFYKTPTRSYIKTRRGGPGETEIENEIFVACCLRTSRHTDEGKPLEEVAYCSFFMDVDCGERGRYWDTIATMLKPGDLLELSWGRDYETNGYLDKAELHGDRLTLIVKRKAKTFTFILGSSVCANNTARMIQRGRFNNE